MKPILFNAEMARVAEFERISKEELESCHE